MYVCEAPRGGQNVYRYGIGMGTYVTFEGGAGDLVSAASDIEGNIHSKLFARNLRPLLFAVC